MIRVSQKAVDAGQIRLSKQSTTTFLAVALFAVLAGTVHADQGWNITSPTDGEEFSPNVTQISVQGTNNELKEVAFTVKIVDDQDVVIGNATGTSSATSTTWGVDVPAPTGGWPNCTVLIVKLYVASSETVEDLVEITITDASCEE